MSESDGGRPHGPLPQEPQVAGRRLPSPQADWQAADCTGLAPVHVQPQHGSHSVCPSVLLTRSRHPQEVFLTGLTATPRLHAVGQGWRRGAVHCPHPTCARRAVF
eukprot:scaffold7016_cov123-Isochrysis_galbana.AAC.1